MQPTSTRYRLLLLALSPLAFAYVCYRTFKDGGLRYFKQRFGFGYQYLNTKPIHFHCASVGEFITAKPLILLTLNSYPEKKILITTNTPTSASLIKKLNHERIQHYYLPLDFAFSVKNFLGKTKPLCCLILETEIWPTFYCQTNKQNIPLAIINARLSKKTLQANNIFKKEYASTLKNVTQILARSKEDYENYIRLGAENNTTKIIGNLKYSVADSSNKQLACTTIKRPFFLAASTHGNEELQIAQHIELLKRKNYLLVIAPRYPERGKELQTQFNKINLNAAMRSQHDVVDSKTDIYIVDTLGELDMYFNEAALVFIGGSLIPRGGHNILEPASFGKCVLVGPHTDNFSNEAKQLQEVEALIQVDDNHQLGAQLIQLLKDDRERERIGQNAMNFIQQQIEVLHHYHHCLKAIIEK